MTIPRAIRRALLAHARRERPQECCGWLLGANGRINFVVPMRNVADSQVRYRIDDAEHIEWRRRLRQVSPALGIVGVYHSHPAGRAVPSPTDVDEAMYPEWIYVIVGLEPPELRAYRIRAGRVRAVPIRWR